MAHTRDYDVSDPADDDKSGLGAQEIREFKVDFKERMGADHQTQNLEDTTLPTADGYHKKVTMEEHATDASAATIRDGLSSPADAGIVFVELKDDIAELFYLDENGDKAQLTTGGVLGGTEVALQNDSARSTGIEDKIILYGDDADDVAELHSMDENDDIIQYSSQGNLCVTNTKQPTAGEADKVLLYAEDRDSKAKLRAIDEDDIVIPIESFQVDSYAAEQSTTSGSATPIPNISISIDGTEGEIYEGLLFGEFKVSSGFGTITLDDTNGNGTPYDYFTDADGVGHQVAIFIYLRRAMKSYLKVTSTGTIVLRPHYQASNRLYAKNLFFYVRRIA